jgi:hypothetical protein
MHDKVREFSHARRRERLAFRRWANAGCGNVGLAEKWADAIAKADEKQDALFDSCLNDLKQTQVEGIPW